MLFEHRQVGDDIDGEVQRHPAFAFGIGGFVHPADTGAVLAVEGLDITLVQRVGRFLEVGVGEADWHPIDIGKVGRGHGDLRRHGFTRVDLGDHGQQ